MPAPCAETARSREGPGPAILVALRTVTGARAELRRCGYQPNRPVIRCNILSFVRERVPVPPDDINPGRRGAEESRAAAEWA